MKSGLVAAFASGALFGAGLAISGMTNRFVVLGFLDVFGDWNPTLAFVMAGAVAVTAIAFRFVLRQPAPACGGNFRVPAADVIDKRLIAGAAIFGAGWGLVGLCPGPALVGAAAGLTDAWIFVPAMLAGSFLAGKIVARLVTLCREAAQDCDVIPVWCYTTDANNPTAWKGRMFSCVYRSADD